MRTVRAWLGLVACLGGLTAAAWSLAMATTATAADARRDAHQRRATHRDGVCAWPFIVTAQTLNIAYPDPNATYWAMPIALDSASSLVVRGIYPSSRFMAVTLYDATGSLITQLSDFEIPPAPGSVNPFAEAEPPALAPQRWRLRVVPGNSPAAGADVLHLGAGQRAGWLVYRVYLGNPPGDLAGSAPLPTIESWRGDRRVRTSPPCPRFLPGVGIAKLLSSKMPDPVVVDSPPAFVRIANDGGLFVNAANAYLSAFATYASRTILVVRGVLPTTPDTGAGEAVVGSYDLRYVSITSNSNVKPYPVVDGAYDAELPLNADGEYTVVVARDADVPTNATQANGVVRLQWSETSASLTVILRNMLPATGFTQAVQDVTPSTYAAPTDAVTVMGRYYPLVATCRTETFEQLGAEGCLAPDTR